MGLNNHNYIKWYHSDLSKSNQICLYCGRFIGINSQLESNEEHLIGKNFIPNGAFGDGNCFNFIFRACKECNNKKSMLEGHISSISIFNNPERKINKKIDALAVNKGIKEIHPNKKGKLIKDSFEEINLSFKNNNFLNLDVNYIAPPQANIKNIHLLAFKHIQGLFSLITSEGNYKNNIRILKPEHFIIYNYFIINDWGNEHLLEIIKRVDGWPCYANINTASGYFKAIIRCNENDNKEWFWALEWNKYFRVIGLIADKMIKQKIFDNLPVIKTYSIGNDIFFKEKPIEKNKDFLFSGTVVEEIYGV